MPYHAFEPGETYSLEHIVSELDRFRRERSFLDPSGKRQLRNDIQARGVDKAVWTPFAEAGWGASPINHRAWKRPDGTDLFRDS